MRKILEFIKAHEAAFVIGVCAIAAVAIVTVVAVQGTGKENKTDVAVDETKGQNPTEGETASKTDKETNGETSGEGVLETEPEYETYVDVVEMENGETETVYVPILPGETAPETKPAVKPSESQTEKVTEKATEKQTEKQTEAPTVKPTEAPTQKQTEAPTEAPTQRPLTAGEKFLAQGGTYTDNGDGTITLTKWLNASGDVVIPSEVDGKTVTAIAHRFFIETSDDSNTGITSITVPGTVKRMDKGQFWNCTNLTKITFNEGVEVINASFAGCLKLTEAYIPSTATVCSSVFACNSEYIFLPGATHVEDYAPYVPAATMIINNSYGNVWTMEDEEYRELLDDSTTYRANTTVVYLK